MRFFKQSKELAGDSSPTPTLVQDGSPVLPISGHFGHKGGAGSPYLKGQHSPSPVQLPFPHPSKSSPGNTPKLANDHGQGTITPQRHQQQQPQPQSQTASPRKPTTLVHHRQTGYTVSAFGAPLERLGAGTGGSVTLHRHPWTGNSLAIKQLAFPDHISHETRLRIVSAEASIAVPLQHPNIIRTFAYVAEEDGSFHTVMEALPRDLFSVVQGLCANPELCCQDRISVVNRMFAQMVDAVAYMHIHHRAVHRDLKLDNICVDERGTPKILDFGCATRFAHNGALTTGLCGSDPYIAPEVFVLGQPSAQGYDARKADVWALGIIYIACVSLHFPWEVAQLKDQNYARYTRRPESVISHWLARGSSSKIQCCSDMPVDPATLSFISRMLAIDPNQRPTCEELLADPWMKIHRS
ncbi:kinase-like protein [Ramicandelaber brevisporus]|nr:kinase-like protein [Ramicandelaber brevisporus]